MPSKQTQNRKNYAWLKLILGAAVVAVGTFGLLAVVQQTQKNETRVEDRQEKNTAEFYRDDEEKSEEKQNDASYDAKERAEQDADARVENQTAENGKTIANVSISSAGVLGDKVIASGMIANMVEEGGSCTYTFTNGNETFTESGYGIANAKNTVCSSANLDKSLFGAGDWTVTLLYESINAEGQSEATTFKVQ